ncbi:autotransporter family protein [Rhodopseudomonas sp. P2A-2r]|uniref:autotransporter family protein n=1 Tax=unclassified Rhodopseudomonas TaxID=2638247 RepID=UPI002234CA26|nr:autotransporter outer membrane beta-barrel domain-containing protein [Rhodopseudomonas sp. P2A-2r]UZE47613.1 autotransporter domain-containing protein [Rhodopseudomonas sp. P2A-2r]
MEHLQVLVRDETTRAGAVVTLQAFSRGVLHRLPQKLSGAAFAALLLNTSPVRAAGGNGGTGQGLIPLFGTSSGGYGVSNSGRNPVGDFGQAGSQVCTAGSGGGGGGGAGGGLGGPGGGPVNAAAGAAGRDNDGCFGGGGGGGGTGGAHGQIGSGYLTLVTPVAGSTGGTGGAGGQVNYIFNPGAGPGAAGNGGGGGGGGEGGYGVYMIGTGARTVDNYNTITGGSGGTGGNAGSAIIPMFLPGITGSGGGNGGDGGTGIHFEFSPAGNTLRNYGTVQGGSGGLGGSGGELSGAVVGSKGTTGNAGVGGVGVVGVDLTVVNAGSISGGLSGDGFIRANAINFYGTSQLTTLAGGTLTGNINIGGVLTLLQTGASAAYGNIFTGDGALAITTAGGNVVSLSGANTYGGGTTVTTGSTLAINNSQSIGSGALKLQSGSTLNMTTPGLSLGNAISVAGIAAIATEQDARITGAIVDGVSPGGLIKTGPGLLILSGTSSYSNLTQVKSGILQVDGSIAASNQISVLSGGVLRGTGTVGKLLIDDGGTFAPGSTPTTSMTVAGTLGFQAGATYLVHVGLSGMTSVNVSGTAFLGGTVAIPASSGWQNWTVIKSILHAGALNGTFAGVSAPPGYTGSLSYSLTDVTLTATGGFASDLVLSRNHGALVAAHDGYLSGGATVPARFDAVLALSGSNLTNALTQISGETPTATHQTGLNAATQFVGTMSDPNIAGRGGEASSATAYAEEGDAMSAYAATGDKRSGSARDAFAMITKAPPRVPAFRPFWNVWASGFGGTQTTDGNVAAGSNTSTSRIGGVAFGADYHLSPQTVAGFALAGGATNFSVVGGGSGRSDLFQLGGFVRHTIGAAYVTASAAYGWQDVTTDRIVSVGGLDQLRANFNTNSLSARLEAGNRFALPWFGDAGVTPYAATQLTYLDLPAYAETTLSGPTTFALAYAAKGITAPRSELGLRSDRSFAVGDKMLTLRGRAAWAHDFDTDRSATATFLALPGASFVVGGASPAANAALTTAAAELTFISGISVGATFEGEFSDVTRSYAGKGVVRYAW